MGVFILLLQIIFTPELESIRFNSSLNWWRNISIPPYWRPNICYSALLAADNELTHWLNQRGVRSEEIEADIRKRHGYQEGPLPIEPNQ